MRHNGNRLKPLLVILALALAACAVESATATTDGTIIAVGPAPVLRIIEVGFAPDFVTLENFSDNTTQLTGRWLCDPPACFQLPELDVEAGATVRIALGSDDGAEEAIISDTGLGPLARGDGELGLYASSDTGDPAAVQDYVEWGTTPHEGTTGAVAAGLWREGSYAPSGDAAIRIFVDPGTGLWLWESSDS
jgi:hypothetical protein